MHRFTHVGQYIAYMVWIIFWYISIFGGWYFHSLVHFFVVNYDLTWWPRWNGQASAWRCSNWRNSGRTRRTSAFFFFTECFENHTSMAYKDFPWEILRGFFCSNELLGWRDYEIPTPKKNSRNSQLFRLNPQKGDVYDVYGICLCPGQFMLDPRAICMMNIYIYKYIYNTHIYMCIIILR